MICYFGPISVEGSLYLLGASSDWVVAWLKAVNTAQQLGEPTPKRPLLTKLTNLNFFYQASGQTLSWVRFG